VFWNHRPELHGLKVSIKEKVERGSDLLLPQPLLEEAALEK
jgi:hypothetical protein